MTTSRTARLSAATLATGVAVSLFGALPAEAAGLPILVDCNTTNPVLDQDGATYDLRGTCGVVTVTGDNVTATGMPATRKLIVKGQHDLVSGKPSDRVIVHGRDNKVTVTSARVARVSSPGSTLHVRGLLELVRVPGNRSHVRADKITKLLVGGNRNVVRSERGETIVHNDGRHNTIRVHKRA